MNIDERLEALTARHEALAQTVEIIAGMQRENEKQLAQTDAQIREIGEQVRGLGQQVGGLAELVHDLVHVADIHHERITRLESR